MSDTAIHVENLSKEYRIVAARHRPDTLKDHLAESLTSVFRRNGRGSPRYDTFWALKDVAFEVKRGEVVGIIGRNGAGKSTLLKILSRITEPTTGRAAIFGRVGSLLEIGTGFDRELSGRENTYLNGAILGMKKAEIDRKFDEIVDFSGVEKFIDTPVKRYSSGMYVRLAFAVAAHLEPEILIVDEVLAVGDGSFQKKCLNKMQDVGKHGRTVLFVSHNMPAITRLCGRAILLEEGRLLADGTPQQVVSVYLNSQFGTRAVREWPDPEKAPGGEVARLRAVRVRTDDGRIIDTLDIREPIWIEMEYDVLKPGYALLPNFVFYNDQGVYAFQAIDLDPAWRRRPRPEGRYVSTAQIPGNLLSEESMFVGAGLETVEPKIFQFYVPEAIAFQVIDSSDGDSSRGDYGEPTVGIVRPLLEWNTTFTPSSRTAAEHATTPTGS